MLSQAATVSFSRLGSVVSQRRHFHRGSSIMIPRHKKNMSRRTTGLQRGSEGTSASGLGLPTLVATQKRHLELNTSTLLLLTKVAAGASVGYFGFRYLKFRPSRQRRGVRATLLRPPDIHIDQSIALLERPRKAEFLRRVFKTPPSGPMIVVGPTGSGKSHLMKRVLSRRPMTIYVDFRREPIVTGEEFVGTFVDNAGYAIPTPNELTKILYREEQRKNKITTFEAENALEIITDVLRREKSEGWKNGIPVICLDDFHLAASASVGNAPVNADPYLVKFLDWCLHIADAKLAHVVIIPSWAFAESFLENYAPLRSKRLQLFIDYPRKEHVRHYCRQVLQVIFKNRPTVTQEQIAQMSDWIFNCVGGNLEDLDQVFSALKRGEHYGSVLRRMITDSVSHVEERLEQIMQQADNLPPNMTKEDVYRRYMRFWKMMELLRDNDHVNRRDLIRVVFKEHTKELAEYVMSGIATYVNQKPADEPPIAAEEPAEILQTDANGRNVVTFLNNSPWQPSWWDRFLWYLGLSQSQQPTPVALPAATTPVAPLSKEATTAASAPAKAAAEVAAAAAATSPPSAAASTNAPEKADPTSQTTAAAVTETASAAASPSTAAPNGLSKEQEEAARAYSTMLNASLDSVLVSAGSPRIRIAFDLLLKDPRIIEATNNVELHLKIKAVKDKLEKAEEKKKQIMFERSEFLKELDTLVQKAAAYKEELGQEVVEVRLKRVLTNETQVDQLLAVLDRQIQELLTEKTQLEAANKQALSRKI
eukprot:TRINITY_DN9870_c0_g1_i1.p1 TRINITY_DN9870_c0_g1~~TRINITY_DN9870_c0_g1_i1.p1  ORF type:complete len:763 (+),score=165.98 TRINITY_DN9870_c0_g1_i1:125-2413(+)